MAEKSSHKKLFTAVYTIENNSTFTYLTGFWYAWVSIRAGQYVQKCYHDMFFFILINVDN